MSLIIEPVSSKSQLTEFIDFPHDLYAGDPNYVPMMYVEQEALLNKRKSPFFEHSNADYFLAKKDGKIVGRIAAIENKNHIQFTGKKEGFFGFFDVINDFNVAKALLDTAADWLKKKSLTKVLGPANFSTNETVGCLVENFDEPSFVMNPYNANYYNTLLQKYGMTKNMDLNCYELITAQMDDKILAQGAELEKRLVDRGYIIRKINMKKFKEDLDKFLPIYNESWSENTGFVPMTIREVKQIAKDLKPVVDPDFIYFVEKDGQAIAVSITLPNLNEIQKTIKKGRLFPTGVFKILFGLKKIKSVRVFVLGTMKEYRRLGIDAVLYCKNIQTARQKGIVRAEASWILENNVPMNRALEHIGGKVYRKYRIYEKDLV